MERQDFHLDLNSKPEFLLLYFFLRAVPGKIQTHNGEGLVFTSQKP